MNYQIFISYRRDGGEFLGKILCDKLMAKGYEVFFDVESMKSGAFNIQLYNVIDQCRDFILILSPHALDRCQNPGDWLYNEISYAMAKGKNIVPVIMRDFEWPQVLPEAIKELPLYENEELARTSSHEHIDASVNRMCRALLESVPKRKYEYHLEEREHYKIKTPWISPYKLSVEDVYKYTLAMGAHVEKVFDKYDDHVYWECLPEFASLEQALGAQSEWFQKNRKRLDVIREKAIVLKQHIEVCEDRERDLYFYGNALAYVIGMEMTLPSELLRYSRFKARMLMAYCMDCPYPEMEETVSVFLKNGGLDYFRGYVLAAFSTWPSIKHTPGISTEEHKWFDEGAILLFDFVLECALFVNDTYRDVQHMQRVRDQILCYYKWLRKNKIYLPKEIQGRIYQYL